MLYIGIDPGKGGGIAVLEDGVVESCIPMPKTDRDVYDFLRDCGCLSKAMLEFVRSSPQMGVTSAFTFGQGYGALRMALCAIDIAFDEVTPQKWQRGMGCLSKGDKNVTKRRAQELFPKVKVTHAIADALLLAEYCRRFHQLAQPTRSMLAAV